MYFVGLYCVTYFNIITSLRPDLPSSLFYNGYFEVPLSRKYSHRKRANHQHLYEALHTHAVSPYALNIRRVILWIVLPSWPWKGPWK